MKKLVTKVQEMGRRAEEIRRVVESVPPKFAEVRAAVSSTVGHVQKTRNELMTGLGTLRAESEAQLLESLKEIDANVAVLEEAGCRVERVDLDLGPTRKLVVHLVRVAERDAERLRALQEANADKATVRALLAAVIKADELAGGVELEELSYSRLTVEIGAYPSVRMGWRPADAEETTATSIAVPAATPAANAPLPVFAQTNFFERRAAGEVVPERRAEQVPTEAVNVEAKVAKGAPVRNAWGADALTRFKKMPALGRTDGLETRD